MGLRFLSSAVLVCILCGAGCRGTSPPGKEAPTPTVLARLFGQYTARNRGRPPATADHLKNFAKQLPPADLKNLGMDPAHIDNLFVSPRDGQPFVFRNPARYGTTPHADTAIIYESVGKEGKRTVIFTLGKLEDVDAARFKVLVPEGG